MYVNWVFFCGRLFTNFARTVGTLKFFVIVQPQYSWLIEWPFSEVVNWNENIVTKYYICYCCLLFYFSYASAVVHQWGFYHKVYFYLLFDVVILEKFVLRDVLKQNSIISFVKIRKLNQLNYSLNMMTVILNFKCVVLHFHGLLLLYYSIEMERISRISKNNIPSYERVKFRLSFQPFWNVQIDILPL